jgi:riboflavin kinase/FMN adenylyltransferase
VNPRFTFTGTIVRGNQMGRRIGFPTVNLLPDKDQPLPLKYGVYAARVLWKDRMLDGMANWGIRPTLDLEQLVLEVNIFDFCENLYGETVTVYLYDYIREEKRFNSFDELKKEIENDRVIVRKRLSDRL